MLRVYLYISDFNIIHIIILKCDAVSARCMCNYQSTTYIMHMIIAMTTISTMPTPMMPNTPLNKFPTSFTSSLVARKWRTSVKFGQ